MESQDQPAATTTAPTAESRGSRARRHGRRAGLYGWAFAALAVLIVLIALIVANSRTVELDWIFGSGHASLVWVVLAAAVLGWLLGIATAILFRFRTRKR
jgi:uncharacterized integral membrane protein